MAITCALQARAGETCYAGGGDCSALDLSALSVCIPVGLRWAGVQRVQSSVQVIRKLQQQSAAVQREAAGMIFWVRTSHMLFWLPHA